MYINMTNLPYLQLLLVIYHYAMRSQCLSIGVSFSNTNISINGSFEMRIDHFLPNASVNIPMIKCGNPISRGVRKDFVQSNPIKKMLVEAPRMPTEYIGRIMVDGYEIKIEPIKFRDEKLTFNCQFTHYDANGNLGPYLVSESAIIENVYALPVITANHKLGSLTVMEGRPKDIICKVRSRPASKITWSIDPGVIGTKNESVQLDPTDKNYFITTATFRINPAYAMNGRKVKCTGIPVFGSAVSKIAALNVLYKPRDTSLFINPSSLSLNAEIRLVCFALAVPGVRNYKFYRNGVLLANTTDGKLSLKVHPSNCTINDGEYKCVPESPLGDGEVKTKIRKFNWKLTLNPSSTITEGQKAVLNCSNTNCPTSDISWKLNGALLPNSGNELKIISATKDDVGTYSCHPSHYSKMKLAEIALTVRYKPDTVIFTSETLKPVNQHKVTLTCSSNGFPTPQYRIFKVSGTSSTLISDGASGNYSMASINYADYIGYNATFMCVSYNTLGNSSAKYMQLDIRVKPLLATPSYLKVKRGANVTFSCRILAANPATNVTWTGPLNQAIQHSNGVVKINNVSDIQLGIYSCHANNSVGKTTKTLRLSFGAVGTILSSKVGTIGSVIVGLAIVIMISDI